MLLISMCAFEQITFVNLVTIVGYLLSKYVAFWGKNVWKFGITCLNDAELKLLATRKAENIAVSRVSLVGNP